LIKAIARKLEIEEATNPEIDELTRYVTPEQVLETIEKQKNDNLKEGDKAF
jgi:agmatine/peptidylarginine deiminase